MASAASTLEDVFVSPFTAATRNFHVLTCEALPSYVPDPLPDLAPRMASPAVQMREACIPAANGRFTAKALAIMYDNFLQSLGLSDGRARSEGWDGALSACAPLLKRSTVNDMRVFQASRAR